MEFSYATKPSRRLDRDRLKHRVLSRVGIRVLILAGVCCLCGTRHVAFGQAQVVLTSVGGASNKSTSVQTRIVVTANVPAGSSVVIAFAMNPVAGAVSAIDTSGNTYVVEADVTNGSGTTGVRTVILAAHGVMGLTAGGSSIAILHPAVGAKAARVISITGLAMSPLDRMSTGTGTGTGASSGTTGSTMQAQEVLFGAIGVEGPVGDGFTPGTGYTAIGRIGTTGGGATTNITISPEYQFVNATGAFQADGTLSPSRRWAAAITTYKVSLPTAVILGAFTAQATGRTEVRVVWSTVSEFDVVGFNVLRSRGEDQPYIRLNSTLIPAQASGTVTGARYSFTDTTVEQAGRYLYMLEMILLDGSTQRFGPVAVQIKPQDVKRPELQ